MEQKQKLNALSLKKFLKLSRLLSPKPTKHDMVLPGGTRFALSLKTGCNWNDRTAEPNPSSGSNYEQSIYHKYLFSEKLR